MNGNQDLDTFRKEMQEITNEIVRLVHNRMELAHKIGSIKQKLNFEIEDEKVENEIKNSVTKVARQIGMDEELSGKLLNFLILESIKLQQVNQNTDQKLSSHMAIFMKAKELENSGKQIIHLEVGEPDYSPPLSLKNVLSQIYDNKRYHYTEIHGIPKLRDAIAKKVAHNITSDQVLVTPGGRFAVFCAITSLLRSGDEIINIEPSWPAYKECADFIGAKIRSLKTDIQKKWEPDLDDLKNLINKNTKMLVLNYPNNPTGKVLDSGALNRIVDIAEEHNLFILSDEVYSDYSFVEFHSILKYGYEKCIMISSFSKTYAMTGFRVGYGISSSEVVSKMKKIQATSITSVAEPMQYCALSALENDPQQNIDLIQSRIKLICERLDKLKIEFVLPDGAMYVYPKLPSCLRQNDVEVVDKLLEYGVAISPGSGFGSSYKQFIRISACQSLSVLNKGLDILETFLLQGKK